MALLERTPRQQPISLARAVWSGFGTFKIDPSRDVNLHLVTSNRQIIRTRYRRFAAVLVHRSATRGK